MTYAGQALSRQCTGQEKPERWYQASGGVHVRSVEEGQLGDSPAIRDMAGRGYIQNTMYSGLAGGKRGELVAKKGKTTPRRMEMDERQAAAMNLRRRGISYERIAVELGYASPSGAYEAVKAGMLRTLREPADELRQLELDRLDDMLEAISENIMAGDLDSIATALRISERRAKLLGLDKPAPLVNMRVDSLNVGESDFANMGKDELRALIRRETKADGECVGGAGEA